MVVSRHRWNRIKWGKMVRLLGRPGGGEAGGFLGRLFQFGRF